MAKHRRALPVFSPIKKPIIRQAIGTMRRRKFIGMAGGIMHRRHFPPPARPWHQRAYRERFLVLDRFAIAIWLPLGSDKFVMRWPGSKAAFERLLALNRPPSGVCTIVNPEAWSTPIA